MWARWRSDVRVLTSDNYISRVPDQNGVSLLYIMLEINHSGREPSNFINTQFHHKVHSCSSRLAQ